MSRVHYIQPILTRAGVSSPSLIARFKSHYLVLGQKKTFIQTVFLSCQFCSQLPNFCTIVGVSNVNYA